MPYLTAVSCGPRPYILNGYYTSWTHTAFGGWAYYRCYYGYQRSGSATIICQASGNWSTRPSCTGKVLGKGALFNIVSSLCYTHKVSCGSPPPVGNGSINSSTGITFGETTIYSCDSGYTLSGSANITCQAWGSWSTPPVCLRKSTFARAIVGCPVLTCLNDTPIQTDPLQVLSP